MKPSSWLRWRVPLGFLLAAWYLVLIPSVSDTIFAASCVLVLLGCALRSWAAGYLLKGKRLAVGGPYAYIRNPLYVGSFLIGGGFCLALVSSPLRGSVYVFWIIFLIGFVVVYLAKSRTEEEELTASLGSVYQDYRKRVPAFFPLRGRVEGLGKQRFSWELYRRNQEFQCLLGGALILGFLYWKGHGPF